MRLGNLTIPGRVFCAPLAGVSNIPYRVLAKRFGADLVFTEMVSTSGLIRGNKMTTDIVRFLPEERPIGIQIFGADPEIMHRGAIVASTLGYDMIDINFGCPVKKVVNKNGGAALLRDLERVKAIIEAVVTASSLPVTVKLRLGWSESTRNFIEVGKIAEQAGVAGVTLHARTRSSKFGGAASWEDIRRLKEEISVPVIGNGDIRSGPDAQRMFEETGCDAIMIGRAALGNPWIFKEINHYLEFGTELPPISRDEKSRVILEHTRLMIDREGDRRGMLMMRKHIAWYTRGWAGGGELRRRIMQIMTYDELAALLSESATIPPTVI